MDRILELERLANVYRPGIGHRPVYALRGLDLTVRRGEIFGLVGPNGAGKTTAFKILLGLSRPSAGSGRILGRPLGDREARRRLGFLPELPAYYPHLSVVELLRFARALSGVAPDAGADLALLEELGLTGMGGLPLRKLSKGQIQRVGLAQALVHAPELLILDEPMSGLDPIGRSLVRARLLREREAGRTVLLSSHVLADVEALADGIGLLAEGELLVQGSPRELLSAAAAAVTVEGSGPLCADALAAVPNAGLRRTEWGWVLHLPAPAPFQLEACLLRLLKGGGSILRMDTEREDLEGFFVRRLVERERRAAGAAEAEEEGGCARKQA